MKLRNKVNFIHVLAVFSLLVQLPSFYGEDIVNARTNYLSGDRIDFWGGISTIAYAFLPDFGFRWQIWLAIIQISLTTLGLLKTLPIKNLSRKHYLINIALAYSALIFGSQMTRDGLMFSLLLFGYASFKSAAAERKGIKFFIIPIMLICFGMSFRPWLSIATIPLVLVLLKIEKRKIGKTLTIVIMIILTLLPLIFEKIAKESLDLRNSYPEQQVMLMDVAATYCYTTNFMTGMKAETAIKIFSEDPNFSKNACRLYRPDTWVSLTQAANASSRGLEVNFSLIKPGELDKYEELKSNWVNMIIQDPVSYLQNKILFSSKLVIGSDGRDLSIRSADSPSTILLAIFRIPYDIAISLHLYSLLALISFLLIGPLKRRLVKKSEKIELDDFIIYLFLGAFIWTTLSSIAYIGSNGRYTYTFTLLSFLVYSSKNFTLETQS